VSEQVGREQLSLPIYPEMTDEEVDAVCMGIREWL
jgi:dTDP-4-amino-4,6-dideoxygalactose transaminase